MWGSLVSGFVNLLASLAGIVRDIGGRKNTPEIKANELARDDAKAQDATEAEVAKASAGDAKSLEEIRREAAE